MKRIFLLFVCMGFMLTGNLLKAQTKFGDNKTVINPSSLVEMESTNKGLLLPRLALTSTTSPAPLIGGAHVAGMYVYNTATAGDVTPGTYYNDGAKWVKAGGATPDSALNDWHITGNYLTTPPATVGTPVGTGHYWGTADAQNLAVGTNATTRAIFDQNGTLFGGGNSTIAGAASAYSLVWGTSNTLSAGATNSLLTGLSNTSASPNSIVAGTLNSVTNAATQSAVLMGNGNTVSSTVPNHAPVALGVNNTINGGVSGGWTGAAIGYGNNLDGGYGNVAIGQGNTVTNTNAATRFNSLIGFNNHITGGDGNFVAGGIYSFGGAFGGATVNGSRNTVIGAADATVTGNGNFLSGGEYLASYTPSTITGNYNGVVGISNAITGNWNLASGYNNKAQASNGLVMGAGNIISSGADYSSIIAGTGITATTANTAYAANIYVPGNVQYGALTAISDRRFKSNFKPIGYGLNTVMQLQPQEYDQVNAYRVKNGKPVTTDSAYTGSHHSFGFVAQDLYKVIPEAVKKPKDESTDNWGVDYARLVPVLTKAIQELNTKNDDLQKKVDADAATVKELKAEIAAIKALLLKK